MSRAASGRDRAPWQDSRLYRERARELLPRIKRTKRWTTAIHEAGHFLVGAYLGYLYESIGLEIGTRVQMGVVVGSDSTARLSRSDRVAMLAGGGLAQQRIGLPVTLGTGSDEDQIDELGLGAAAVAKARRRATAILDLVWPDVLVLAEAVAEHNVLAGETALAFVLASQPDGELLLGEDDSAKLTHTYAASVRRRAAARGA